MRHEPNIKSILLTTAFRDLSQRAAPIACALAQAYGAKVHVLHVLEGEMEAISTPDDLGAFAPVEPRDGAVATAHRWLEQFVDHHIAPLHAGAIEAVVCAASVYKAICSYAREHRIDLIVMGTHGDSMLHRMLNGSISKAVVEHAPCPVLLVPCPRVPEPVASEPAVASM
jgi:nucleotide-binding universal stress UspA family protein